jgi:type II secretory pathway component PulJ
MRSLRDQRGFTTIEMMVSCALMVVLLAATLGPMDSFWKTNRHNFQQNDTQDRARQSVDQISRELRNAAIASQLVEKAAATDLVFQVPDKTTNPSGTNTANIQRVRYCLDSSSPVNLIRQKQTWTTTAPPSLPSTAACPGASPWGAGQTMVSNVADAANSATLFTYDTGTLADIRQVNMDLWVDLGSATKPLPSEVKTGVALRNQNHAPVASFTATALGSLHVQLDAAASYDSDGNPITYTWCLAAGCASSFGSGRTYDYRAGATGSLTIYLDVTDTGGLVTETSQTVTVT